MARGHPNAASVKKAVGDNRAKEDQTHNALLISEQIGPSLAAGTRGNPTQVKRFLNTLLLRQESARARGFVEDVELPVLAKLMLAERFNPRVFDQIATVAASAPDGVCPELAVLEEAVRVEPQEKPSIQGLEDAVPAKKSQRASLGKAEHDRAETQTAIAKEWLASDSAKEWAKLRPSMAGVDLRPYLFVAKDRKDYCGAVTQFGQVAAIAEKLLGAQISVKRKAKVCACSHLRRRRRYSTPCEVSSWRRTTSSLSRKGLTAWTCWFAHNRTSRLTCSISWDRCLQKDSVRGRAWDGTAH